MSENQLAEYSAEQLRAFDVDTGILSEQFGRFLSLTCPAHCVNDPQTSDLLESDSTETLKKMRFFRIVRCGEEDPANLFEKLNSKVEKLFTALHTINIPIAYGAVGHDGETSVVIGVMTSTAAEQVNKLVRGMLSDMELEVYGNGFGNAESFGLLSGAPTLEFDNKKQSFSLAPIMKTLNGENYTVLVIAKPIPDDQVSRQIDELLDINDKVFSVRKRSLTRSASTTDTQSHTDSFSNTEGIARTESSSTSRSFGVFSKNNGFNMGVSKSRSKSETTSESVTKGISDTISKAMTNGSSIGAEMQNSCAIELMKFVDKTLMRLKNGLNNGVWQTAICYSAGSDMSRDIINACLRGELSGPESDRFPPASFAFGTTKGQAVLIPRLLNEDDHYRNDLCAYINSSEFGLLCTPPTESVPDFEIRIEKQFPMIRSNIGENKAIGRLCQGKIPLDNMLFGLSDEELNRHTFVCGMTGSGKTTAVKRILVNTNKPFMVVEPAKKEYRGIPLDDERKPIVYTFGKPEINCLQINPFYIMPGISPQMHIDFLKDLFVASFSFYGPMQYIIEKCLHNVYKNKGWNLTLGFHPLLNKKNGVDMYDDEYISQQYAKTSHKLLFPTMNELKNEVARYVREEMEYDGEVAGNIKTAIKVRLENLCVGAKGFMFNTMEFPDVDELFNKNTVIELEGLADDSDKAFCMGLVIILINEYRQIEKERMGNDIVGLSHIFVIEEAHRLLKNVDTEHADESFGNPKGKAVEHFTNMLAEMRSYGQGVIVAEQIPSKLTADVIKNSSNKIVGRLVSSDDQRVIANTIGISETDALRLGTLEKGFALCHKEGMQLPVSALIDNVNSYRVNDEVMFNKNIKENLLSIDRAAIGEILSGDETKLLVIGLFNTLLIENAESAAESCKIVCGRLGALLQSGGFTSVSSKTDVLVAEFLADRLLALSLRGIYVTRHLPDNNFVRILHSFTRTASAEKAECLKNEYDKLYECKANDRIKRLIAALNKRDENAESEIRAYFIKVSDDTVGDICNIILNMEERNGQC